MTAWSELSTQIDSQQRPESNATNVVTDLTGANLMAVANLQLKSWLRLFKWSARSWTKNSGGGDLIFAKMQLPGITTACNTTNHKFVCRFRVLKRDSQPCRIKRK